MGANEESFDVVICGGGIAGLTLARQLKRERADLSVLIIEKTPRPLPIACFKVGESTVEIGGRYLAKTLGLGDYLDKKHFPKLGLRFFFGDQQGPLEERPEFGETRFPPPFYGTTYQIDRGIFENDLRAWNSEDGVVMVEEGTVEDIAVGTVSAPHRITYRSGKDGTRQVTCRWVIDALGRRRFLQNKLGLKADSGHRASSAWFRMKGRLEVDDMVPARCVKWHARVPGRIRYYSTNHLMGEGYWVWLIPLPSDHTSIGIVTDETIHPLSGYGTFPKALEWLREHEPRLADFLDGREPLDFLKIKDFSYASKRVFSPDRWCCIGESAVFPDPFYSPGMDSIALSNTMVTKMILSDQEGRLGPGDIDHYDKLFRDIIEGIVELYRGSYGIFGNTHVMTAKLIWDWTLYWAVNSRLFYLDLIGPEFSEEVNRATHRALVLQKRVQDIFRVWGKSVPSRETYGLLVLTDIPFLHSLRVDLMKERSKEEGLKALEAGLLMLEELAHVLYRQALEETSSAVIGGFPETEPRDTGIKDQLAPVFRSVED